MTGSPTLRLLVRPDGTVREVDVVSTSGHPELDGAARAAVAGCRYRDGPVKPTAEESITMQYMCSGEDLPEPAMTGATALHR